MGHTRLRNGMYKYLYSHLEYCKYCPLPPGSFPNTRIFSLRGDRRTIEGAQRGELKEDMKRVRIAKPSDLFR